VTNSERNKRALILLAAGLVIAVVLEYGLPSNTAVAPAAAGGSDSAALEQRLGKLRQIAATRPAAEALMKQASADLADRERGMIQADTAAQAQAALLEVASRLGREEQLDVRGGDLGAPRVFGEYGLVYATVSFECHIEQLVNFLADLAREPQLIVPAEERISAVNPKEKTMIVRMVLAGVVPKKLVPEKKGLAGF
jgi:hypothetical protein